MGFIKYFMLNDKKPLNSRGLERPHIYWSYCCSRARKFNIISVRAKRLDPHDIFLGRLFLLSSAGIQRTPCQDHRTRPHIHGWPFLFWHGRMHQLLLLPRWLRVVQYRPASRWQRARPYLWIRKGRMRLETKCTIVKSLILPRPIRYKTQ